MNLYKKYSPDFNGFLEFMENYIQENDLESSTEQQFKSGHSDYYQSAGEDWQGLVNALDSGYFKMTPEQKEEAHIRVTAAKENL